MNDGGFKNLVLRGLTPDVLGRLSLRRADLPDHREIEVPGHPIEDIYFIEDGIAVMTTAFQNGRQIGVALSGFESVLGASVLMRTKRSLNRVHIQVGGRGFSTKTELAATEFKRCGLFQELILDCVQAQFLQSAQTAGCNAHHSVEQRLARWLLLYADRNEGRPLPLSHECIAEMIGARRSTVTVMAGQLQARNLIRYTRGNISILDRPGLEVAACECYRLVEDHLTDHAEYNSGM